MDVWTTPDAAAFAARAQPWLAEHPVLTNVIATVTEAFARGMFRPDDPWFATAQEGGRVVAAAMHTRPTPYVGPGPDGAVEAIADGLLAAGRTALGVTGPLDAAGAFARRWSARTGAGVEVTMSEGVYLLTALRPPDGVPGRARVATAADLELCVRWLAAFGVEAMHQPPAAAGEAAELVRGMLGEGRLLLWEAGGEPVALAGRQGPAHGTGRVGPVWTPPEHRRRGYAAAVTAAVTRALLDGGAERCILFTDLANPTSNGVYLRLGYEQVAEAVDYAFTAP
jgi:ribosomal protein S18 acetylase RimI-like enzyme